MLDLRRVYSYDVSFFPFKSETKLLLTSAGMKSQIKLENKVFISIQNTFFFFSLTEDVFLLETDNPRTTLVYGIFTTSR